MDLIGFIGHKVKIILTNNYYFIGIVLDATDESLDLRDIKGQRVALRKESILSIQEVKNAL